MSAGSASESLRSSPPCRRRSVETHASVPSARARSSASGFQYPASAVAFAGVSSRCPSTRSIIGARFPLSGGWSVTPWATMTCASSSTASCALYPCTNPSAPFMMLLSGSVKFACAPSAGRPPVVACVSLRGSAPGRAAAPPPAGLSSGGSSSPARARRFAAFVLSPLRTRASSCFAAVASIPSACPRNARARAVRASSSQARLRFPQPLQPALPPLELLRQLVPTHPFSVARVLRPVRRLRLRQHPPHFLAKPLLLRHQTLCSSSPCACSRSPSPSCRPPPRAAASPAPPPGTASAPPSLPMAIIHGGRKRLE